MSSSCKGPQERRARPAANKRLHFLAGPPGGPLPVAEGCRRPIVEVPMRCWQAGYSRQQQRVVVPPPPPLPPAASVPLGSLPAEVRPASCVQGSLPVRLESATGLPACLPAGGPGSIPGETAAASKQAGGASRQAGGASRQAELELCMRALGWRFWFASPRFCTTAILQFDQRSTVRAVRSASRRSCKRGL